MSITINFLHPDERIEPVEADPGMTLMEVAREAGIEGIPAECGGGAICSTCHVHILPQWFDLTGGPTPTEQMLLDLAPGRDDYSRLSCQIELRQDHDGLAVKIPEEQADY